MQALLDWLDAAWTATKARFKRKAAVDAAQGEDIGKTMDGEGKLMEETARANGPAAVAPVVPK